MQKLLKLSVLYIITLLFTGFSAAAQIKVEEDPSEGSVVLYADPRLAMLTNYVELSQKNFSNNISATSTGGRNQSGSIHSGKGYRIIIYSGIDRAKANSTKADFMRKHPGTRIYMTYSLPQFKIKVGDYTSRKEANDFYRQLSSSYSPCMIVPDIVEINTFRRND